MRIDIEDLNVAYAGRTVVAGAHLVAADGEITGLVGPNGSGKSTPWHSAALHRTDGTWTLMSRKEAARLGRLVQQGGRPSHFTQSCEAEMPGTRP